MRGLTAGATAVRAGTATTVGTGLDGEAAEREAVRLAGLRAYDLLDTPAEQVFDDAVALLSALCETPIALVSLVDEHRQWFKAALGVEARETPRDTSVCSIAIQDAGPFVVNDLSADRRTAGMSLVQGEAHLRFYAGVPLITSDGVALGSLCAIDVAPRPEGLTAAQTAGLVALGRQVTALIEARLARRREAEALAALDAQREELELATRAARLGRFDFRPQEGRLVWDDRCRELFGLRPGAPVSYETAFLAGLHPEDRERADAAVSAALDPAGSRTFNVEYRTIGIEDRLERHVHAQGLAFFDSGRPVRLIGTVQDVTADRVAQSTLSVVSERLRLAVRATNDAIWDWDLVADQVLWNEALQTAYGHPPEDTGPDGAWWLEQIHADDRERVADGIHAVIDGAGHDWTDEYRFRRSDGGYADIRDRGSVIRDVSGRAIRMIGAMLDQTEAKAAQRSLERQVEARTRDRDRLWRMSDDLMLVARLDGEVTAANPACRALLGRGERGSPGTRFLELVQAEDQPAAAEALSALAESGRTTTRFEARSLDAQGETRWIAWTVVAEDGFVTAVGRDVTEERARTEALARMEEQLRQSQKMEAVGQLTGGIAHDFNNMLTGVIGSLDLLKTQLAQGRHDRANRYIEAATTSAHRAAGLTHRLLAFSRRQSLDIQPVDVAGVIAGMEDLLRRTLGESVALGVELPPDLWPALSDANQLESALLNLSINARDAMPVGGRLTLSAANVLLYDPPADADYEDAEPGDYVVISVADTGTGMSPEVAAKAFEPFFTTKPIGQGTGLGLSMIYGFMRQTGGRTRIETAPGEGTTVKLYLRRHDGPVAAEPPAAPSAPRTGAGERVMVVEDDPAVRMILAEVLETLGYDMIQAEDGQEAARRLADGVEIDLLITDVGLPGLNGRQVADLARERLPHLKVLFVTGYAEQAAVRSGFLEPGMDMILKPFAVEEISAKLRAMIEG